MIMRAIVPLLLAYIAAGHRLPHETRRWLQEDPRRNVKSAARAVASLSHDLEFKRPGQAHSSTRYLQSLLFGLHQPVVPRRLNSWRSSFLARSHRMAGTSSSQDNASSPQGVIKTLEEEIPKILLQEPSWSLFAEDLTLVDQTGAKIEGLAASKYLLRVAQIVLPRKFDMNNILFSPTSGHSEHLLLSRLKIRVSRRSDEQWAFFGTKDEPVDFEVEIGMSLNVHYKIEKIRVGRWLTNGKSFPFQLKLWPDVALSDDRPTFKRKIKDWYASLYNLQPLNRTVIQQVRDSFVPTRREFATTAAIQVGVLLVGRGEIERFQRSSREGEFDAIQGLQNDIPRILIEEPDWRYFDDDFTLIDQVGVKVKGIGPNKRLLKVLRNLRDGLFATPLKADFDATTSKFMLDNGDGTRQPVLVADWTLSIDVRARIPYDILSTLESQTLANLRVSSFPIVISGQTCFQFTEEKKVKVMKIDEWSINGKKVQLDLLKLKLPIGNFYGEDEETTSFRQKIRELEKRIDEVEAKADAQVEGESIAAEAGAGETEQSIADIIPEAQNS